MKRFLSLIVLSSIFFSCSREGLNGKATVVVYPMHHTTPIINHIGYSDTVYIKFNTSDLPGTKPSDYDTYFVGDPRTDFINCPKLKWGDYYFLVAGYDSTILSRVIGGAHVKIKQRDRKDSQDVTINVTE